MSQLNIERKLTISYTISAIMGIIASITTGVTWNHWYSTLDHCIGRNCSCILYGKNTPSRFLGGDQAPCIWVTFGPLLYVFFALCMICFHGYRILWTSNSPTMRIRKSVLSRNHRGSSIQIETIAQEDTSLLPKAFWVTMSVLTSIFVVYSIIHFAIFLDGFWSTCGQYRKALEVLLGIHGTALPVLHSRLYCQSIFDFMDYMQLDSANAFRNGYINTGLALNFGILAACFGFIFFLVCTGLNISMARKKQSVV